ncbi:U-box domain-containing protein 26-like [Phragmites australis]|uniref:U-box domain-containing protein 26-like n=1 Tax=Phragmites australis TaxID=29695 RepID=UPI002D77B490|nr:U-box domain-containing protein 26-like [Phragmites australis]
MSVPYLFRCPISLDIFTDPVTLSTGQTYDRPCIERWLDAGHRTCPVTMQPLGDTVLVPNRTLRHLIERWLSADHQLPEQAVTDDAEEPSLAALKRCLQSGADGKGKAAALKKVMTLASESDVGRACMLQLGFLPVLLQLVFHTPTPWECHLEEEEELALQCALSLLPSSPAAPQLDCLNMLRKEANLASFVRLLERGRERAKASLCRLLETIATADATQMLALVAAASPRVWQGLLPLLQHDDERVSGAAVRAVAAVCAAEPACASAIRHGAVGALFKLLAWAPSEKRGGAAASTALAAIESLASSEARSRAVAQEPGAVRVLVRHVFMMSSRNEGSEHAVAALLAVCRDSRAARSEAASAGVVTQVLLLLQSQCGARANAKARALLKLLKSM